MADEKVVVAIVVGVTSGVIGAYIGNSTIRRLQEQIHTDQLEEAETEGFKRGYDTLAGNPGRMRNLLEKLKDTD
jgi:hypothetical protein